MSHPRWLRPVDELLGPVRTAERLRVAILGPVKLSLGPPFGGGLEAHTWHLAAGLRDRGHQVTLFGPDAPEGVALVRSPTWSPPASGRRDISAGPEAVVSELHAQLAAIRRVASGVDDFDVVHDNSGHHLPSAMAGLCTTPTTVTLHTPPTPWMASALALGGAELAAVVTVSRHCARAWADTVQCDEVIPNGVDLDLWAPAVTPRTGAVWLGRIVPEKGPHLAIQAARRAGVALRLAGPIHDVAYFDEVIAPELGNGVTHEGHLLPTELAEMVRSAAVTLVTSVWDEPFGQVVAESLACGTPVAGFASGALPEIVTDDVAVLVPAGDLDGLAAAIPEAMARSAVECRRFAVEHFALERMVASYEGLLASRVRSGQRSA